MTVSTTNTHFSHSDRHGLWGGIVEFFAGLRTGFRAYETFSRLDAMTDAQLAARGLSRQDVARKAMDEILKD